MQNRTPFRRWFCALAGLPCTGYGYGGGYDQGYGGYDQGYAGYDQGYGGYDQGYGGHDQGYGDPYGAGGTQLFVLGNLGLSLNDGNPPTG